MPKEIIVPAPITLKDQLTGASGQTVSIREWAFIGWLTEPRWHQDLARLAVVAQEFSKKLGEKMVFRDDDYSVLAEIVKNHKSQQPPLMAMQLESFKTLVLEAKSTSDK